MLTFVRSHRHRSYLLPGLSHDVEAAQKAERMQLRREELEKSIKTESFYNWKAMQKEKYPESLLTTDPVW
jgi:E3 ubiquitin-protein ligase RHA2